MGQVVEALVPGGKANPGPPLGPALGPLGVNIKEIVDSINEKTADFNGMQVPVKIIFDAKKNYTIEIGTPPTSALILKELGIEKGSGHAGTDMVGNLSIEQAAKVARMKRDSLLATNFKSAVNEIIGSCVPMGVTVEGMDPREAQKAVKNGNFNDRLES
ncbi:MAG: 50S ribosomal protein L11 [Methanosarcinales archaeon]|nr:50S ribosomal protein L11 [ANME-2 cluster archaeon]MDF1531145.1 50S ribosomal protein L11 [ANME-2 cluster archaeon]MDW7777194.1 50S ribosomal protein L11 [Methanosarcinales archaeon]